VWMILKWCLAKKSLKWKTGFLNQISAFSTPNIYKQPSVDDLEMFLVSWSLKRGPDTAGVLSGGLDTAAHTSNFLFPNQISAFPKLNLKTTQCG
jgi:hypothetical protein